MSAARTKLHAGNVVVRFGDALIVDGASLDLRAGELTVLIGPNGAGKTTLMRALAGLVPAEGHIEIEGKPLASITVRERARRIAYLPQGHVFHWPMPVAAVVALGRYAYGDAFSTLSDADRARRRQGAGGHRNGSIRNPRGDDAIGRRARARGAGAGAGLRGADPVRRRADGVARSASPARGDAAPGARRA